MADSKHAHATLHHKGVFNQEIIPENNYNHVKVLKSEFTHNNKLKPVACKILTVEKLSESSQKLQEVISTASNIPIYV